VKKLEPSEILDLTAYEKIRDRYRAETIEMKRSRRLAVGDRLMFIFENRKTVRFQIQEMIRTERIVLEEAVAAEVAVYNALIPGEGELSATLMIEIPDLSQVRSELDRLVGIDEHVAMVVGGEAVPACFDDKQFEAGRIAAVQYLKFPLGADLALRFRDPSVAVTVEVAHPNLRVVQVIEGALRASLADDLAASG
jgi:hypothetical protein